VKGAERAHRGPDAPAWRRAWALDTLRDTVLVIFGNPAGGTLVMQAAPLSALDLPLKVLIWSDNGQTKVSFVSPDALASRHHLGAELAGNLRGIEALTDALVAAAQND
jgi:uncharacterized protein (DUF302 family)